MNSPSHHPLPSAAIAFGSRVRPSPFYAATLRWGATVFSVYNHSFMPIVYESAERDYYYLTNTVTLWDVTGERQVQIAGPDAQAFVQYLTPRDLSSCAVGRCRYILLTDENGGVLNDPVLLRLAEDKFWLSLADSDVLLWCKAIAMRGAFDVQINIPDVSPLQLQGPRAPEVATALFGDWARELPYFHLRELDWDGIPLVVSRTGWSGEAGYEIYLRDGEQGDLLWDRIMVAGAAYDIRPAAPSTIRRIEAGLLSYGADIHLFDTPFHLNLERLTDLDADFDFIGKEALLEVRRQGVTSRLVGVEMDGAPMNAPHVRWWNATSDDGQRIGKVRSSIYSPRMQKNIGMAMIDNSHNAPGTSFSVQTEYGETVRATTRALPFIQNKAKK